MYDNTKQGREGGTMKKESPAAHDTSGNHNKGEGSGSVIKRSVHGTRPFGGDLKRGHEGK
jgi:hypothetical protein